MLKYVIEYVQKHCKEELEMLGSKLPVIDKIPTVTFTEAKEIMLEKFGHKSKNRYDLNPDEEVMMCQWAEETYGSEFVFVTHFPSAKRPFYAMDDAENPSLLCRSTCCSAVWKSPPAVSVSTTITSRSRSSRIARWTSRSLNPS